MLRNFKKPLALSIALIMTSAVCAYAEETPVETVEAEAVETVETVETETDNVETAETEAIVETDDAAETDEAVDNIVSEPDDAETADKPVTRLDVAEALFSLAGETETGGTSSFSDTDAPSVSWLYENGIGAGFEDGTFRPDENVTREQLAMFIYNYMKYQGKDVSNIKGMGIYEYTDYNDISEWALTAVRYCRNAGLIPTGPGMAYGPGETVAKAELAGLLSEISNM